MAKFTDTSGREWKVEFDGLLLDEVRQATGVDIADLSAGGFFRLGEHIPTRVKVLAVLCAEERAERKLTEREFSKAISGKTLDYSLDAIVSAAQNFFPPKTWSEMQSRWNQQKAFSQDWRANVQPLLMQLNAPEMPQAMRDAIMAALTEMMGNIGSRDLEKLMSAGGQAAQPPNAASDSPENAESTRAA